MIHISTKLSKPVAGLIVVALAAGFVVALAGCKQSAPEPSGPGYYTGPMKPKQSATSQGVNN